MVTDYINTIIHLEVTVKLSWKEEQRMNLKKLTSGKFSSNVCTNSTGGLQRPRNYQLPTSEEMGPDLTTASSKHSLSDWKISQFQVSNGSSPYCQTSGLPLISSVYHIETITGNSVYMRCTSVTTITQEWPTK